MFIARVIGDVVATSKNAQLTGRKLLLVQPLNLQDEAEGKALIAIDSVQAGTGDRVLVMREGGGARIILNNEKIPVQAVIVGIVDGMDIKQ